MQIGPKYVQVPVEPTDAMLDAGMAMGNSTLRGLQQDYTAMLAAHTGEQPPVGPQDDEFVFEPGMPVMNTRSERFGSFDADGNWYFFEPASDAPVPYHEGEWVIQGGDADDSAVERVARALCIADGADWDAKDFNQTPSGESPEEMREGYMEAARAAIAAMGEG